jgi:hypothetical protein
MHQSFGNVGDLDGKSLRASETLVSEVYAGCNGPGHTHAGCMRIGCVQWME